MKSIPRDLPADLAALAVFLASDAAPDGCMTLSELDGFLAGIIAGPEPVMPSVWLRVIWGEEEPVFDDQAQASAVLGAIMHRYSEIAEQLGAARPAYHPILGTAEGGEVDATDWALGFVRAITLREAAWKKLTANRQVGLPLLAPILLFAGRSPKANLPPGTAPPELPEELAPMLAQPGPLLAMCAADIRRYFMDPDGWTPRWQHRAARTVRPAGKRRRKRW